MTYQVYVLKSLKSGVRYVGFTTQSLNDKVQEHNQGATRWTRANKPFELIYSEEFADKTRALKRENFLKTGNGRRVLDNLLNKN